MTGNRISTGLLLLGVLLAVGCAKPYIPPKAGESAAILKLKFSYNHENARNSPPENGINRAISVSMSLNDGEDTFSAYGKSYPGTLESKEAQPLEIQAVRVHPGKPLQFFFNLGVTWQTQKMETVWKEKRTPKQVRKSVYKYNYSTKRNEMVYETVTEYETERYQVQELVTKNHAVGCNADVSFTPMKDELYLLDYNNADIGSGCAVQAYRQTPSGGGNFKLEPVEITPVTKKIAPGALYAIGGQYRRNL